MVHVSAKIRQAAAQGWPDSSIFGLLKSVDFFSAPFAHWQSQCIQKNTSCQQKVFF